MTKILMVLSAADKWTRADGTTTDSGVWAEEFIVLDEALIEAGYQVDLASPGGRAPTIDARSLSPSVVGQETADKYRAYLEANAERLRAPLALAEVDPAAYDAVVVPGGHGPVEDLYKDADMGRVLLAADRAAKPIASVCHGPAALLAATDAEGGWPFAGRKLTAFSDEEEVAFGTAENAPWLLAACLRKRGAAYEKGPNWGSYVVRDGNLLTGQNPASTAALAEALIEVLG